MAHDTPNLRLRVSAGTTTRPLARRKPDVLGRAGVIPIRAERRLFNRSHWWSERNF
jgi:hypothetical protein